MHILLDRGHGPVDPQAHRLLEINNICESFGCMPQTAERALDEDPERLVLKVMAVRQYVAAKQAFDRNNDNELKAWGGNPFMTLVQTNAYALRRALIPLVPPETHG